MDLQHASQNKGFWAALAAAGCSAYLFWRTWRLRARLPPGKFWMWPVLGESLRYVKNPLKFIEDKLTEHGGTCRSNLLLANSVILAVTEENAKLILSKKDLGWPKHFQKVVGERALPMVNDPLHKKIRTVNSRAFADRQLDSYLPKLQRLSAKYLENWVGKAPGDIHMEMKKYSYECGEAVILGESEQVKTDRYMQLFAETIKGLGYVLPFNLPGFPFRQCMLARQQLAEGFKEVIEQKRKKLKDPVRMFKISTMLDTMLQTEGMDSEEELLDFCIGMMFAAHDTTLCSVQSSLYWLKQLPALEEELRREVRELWDGSLVNRKILESMHKTRAFIQEVLRITPPVVVISRTLKEDTEVDGYVVPRGWTLYYAPAGKHSKAEEPEKFSMQRHLKDGKFLDRTFDPTYFNSFGGGNRMCIGYKFARDEMLVFMLNFLYSYDLKVDKAELQQFPFHFWRLSGSFQKS